MMVIMMVLYFLFFDFIFFDDALDSFRVHHLERKNSWSTLFLILIKNCCIPICEFVERLGSIPLYKDKMESNKLKHSLAILLI